MSGVGQPVAGLADGLPVPLHRPGDQGVQRRSAPGVPEHAARGRPVECDQAGEAGGTLPVRPEQQRGDCVPLDPAGHQGALGEGGGCRPEARHRGRTDEVREADLSGPLRVGGDASAGHRHIQRQQRQVCDKGNRKKVFLLVVWYQKVIPNKTPSIYCSCRFVSDCPIHRLNKCRSTGQSWKL